jgi:hypothetical protein
MTPFLSLFQAGTLEKVIATFQNHTGEEWFAPGPPMYIALGICVLVYLLLTFTRRLPQMNSFKEFADVINSAGGHILILTLFSAWFFAVAMRFFFHVLGLTDEIITKHEAIVMTGIGFVTGTAFGGAWGALLKTMTGGQANGKPQATSVTVPPNTPASVSVELPKPPSATPSGVVAEVPTGGTTSVTTTAGSPVQGTGT